MKKLSLAFALVAVSIFAIGCDKPATNNPGANQVHSDDDGHVHTNEGHEGHDHAAQDHTPVHGGHLVELGRNHEYHAELVDDHQAESLTIYLMDADMKPLTVHPSSLTLILTADDDTQTFELTSVATSDSAEFNSSDMKLMEMMESAEVTGKIRVTIDGKPFTGSFDHLGHGHAGEQDESHAGHNHP